MMALVGAGFWIGYHAQGWWGALIGVFLALGALVLTGLLIAGPYGVWSLLLRRRARLASRERLG